MLDALKANARDLILAAFAAFVGGVAMAFTGDVTLPGLKALLIAGGYAALRKAVDIIAEKLAAKGSTE